MGAGQSNLEAMLGAVGDIYDDTPSRTDAFVDVETLPPVADNFRLVAAADPPPTREDKRIDERLQRAIALAATLGTAEGAEKADGAEKAEGAEGEEAEGAEGAEGAEKADGAAEAEGAEETGEAEGTEGSEETEGSESEDETESAGESSDDEPDAEGAGFTIATCARAMGHEPVRLYPATAENVARVIGAGHAVLAVLSASEEAHVVVMRGYSGAAASFEATVFPPTGEPRDESIDARDLRFMYGFWHVRPRGPPAGAAEAER
jgi:hypothetical protein